MLYVQYLIQVLKYSPSEVLSITDNIRINQNIIYKILIFTNKLKIYKPKSRIQRV